MRKFTQATQWNTAHVLQPEYGECSARPFFVYCVLTFLYLIESKNIKNLKDILEKVENMSSGAQIEQQENMPPSPKSAMEVPSQQLIADNPTGALVSTDNNDTPNSKRNSYVSRLAIIYNQFSFIFGILGFFSEKVRQSNTIIWLVLFSLIVRCSSFITCLPFSH